MLCKDLHGRGTATKYNVNDGSAEIDSEICKMLSTQYKFLDDMEDLMFLSALDQNVINYYEQYVALDESKAKAICAAGQNNAKWNKNRQVSF